MKLSMGKYVRNYVQKLCIKTMCKNAIQLRTLKARNISYCKYPKKLIFLEFRAHANLKIGQKVIKFTVLDLG
jgi:hypothetical protein